MSQQLEQRLRSLEATLLVNPRDPWTHTRRGHILLQLGRLDEAGAAFDKVVTLAPTMPEGPQGLGEVELARGQWDGARTQFSLALGLDKNHVPTLASLIRAHEERRELPLAEPYYAAVLQAKPEDADWLRRASLNLYVQRKLQQALPLLARAHARLEQDDEITAALGICQAHEQHLEAARALLEPLSARAVLAADDETTFADVLTRLRDWVAATPVWSRLKSVASANLLARFGLGRCHEERGLHREAIEEVAPVLDRAADADAYWVLGRAYTGLSNPSDALRVADLGLARFGTDSRLHVIAGQALVQLGRLKDAVTYLDRAVRYAPDTIDAWLLLADAHCRLEHYDAASLAHERIVGLAPNEARYHLARAEFERAHGTLPQAKECFIRAFHADSRSCPSALGVAVCASELGEMADARQWVKKALAIDPGDVDALKHSGLLYLREGRTSEALRQLSEVSRSLPRDAEILRAIAQCHRALDDALHEAETLERAIDLEPDAATGKRLGQVCSDLRRYERAVEVLAIVLKETPNDAEAHRDQGLAFEHLGQLDSARAALARACDLDRADPIGHFALGRVCLKLDDAAPAVTALEHASRLDAHLADLEMTLGRAYHRLGLLREAAQVYRQLVTANAKDVSATFELGRVLAASRQVADASHYLERVVELDPSNGRAWLLLGELRQAASDAKRAIECFRKATLIHPDSTEAFRGLGQTAASLEQHDEAVRATRQWLRLEPNDSSGLAHLANSLEALSQFGEALTVWQQALKEAPNSHEFVLRLGLVMVRLNRFDDAVEHLSQALPQGTFPVEHWETLANCLERLGNRDELVSTLNTVCKLDPSSGARWRRLGFAELSVGHEPKALVALEQAWALGANDEEGRATIAELYRKLANRELLAEHPDASLAALAKAIEYLPNDVELRVARGSQLRQLDRPDEAIAAYESAITLDAYRVDSHLALAELTEQKNDLDRAIALYSKVQKLAPDNHGALSGLARTLWQSGRQRDALEVLERVVNLSPERADARLQLGSLLLLEKRPKDALAHLITAAEALPLDATAQHTLATCYAELGQDSSAVSAYERALAQCPKQLDWSRQLVSSLQRLGKSGDVARVFGPLRGEPGWTTADAAVLGIALAEVGRNDDAVAPLREAIAVEPTDELWLTLLECLWHLERHADVIECSNSILAENPANPRALELAALGTLASGGDESRAVALYERLLSLQPDNAKVQQEIVRLRTRRAVESAGTSTEAAIVELRRALELSPNDADIRYRLADCYRRTNQPQQALDCAKICLGLDERYQLAWLLRGELEVAAGRFSDAKVSYARAVDLAPEDPAALAGLARVLESLDELADAAGVYQKLSSLEPRTIEWRDRLVSLLSELGDKPALIEHLTALGGLRRFTDPERRRLGFLHAEVGQHELAVEHLNQVLVISPSDQACLLQLAESLTLAGRQVESIPWLERLVRLDPAHRIAIERLGVALSCAGRHEQALGYLERAQAANPTNGQLLEALVQSYSDLGKTRQKLVILQALSQLQPASVAHFTAIGQLQIDLGQDEEAIEPWQRAVALGADSALRDQLFDLLVEQADHAILAQKLDVARERLAQARAQAGQNAARLLACARRLQKIGDLPDAVQVAQQSQALADELEVNLLLGELWLERRQPLDASLRFERALELRVDSTVALIGLGHAQLSAQAFTEAEATLQRAAHLAPEEAEVGDLLVLLYEQTNRLAQAVAAQKGVVALRSNDVDVRIRLSELQVRVGDNAGAVESLEAASSLKPDSEPVLALLADAHAHLERWTDVLSVVDRAKGLNPEMAAWNERRGVALSRLDRVAEAIVALESVREVRPADARVEGLLADLYARSGQAAAAAVDPRTAVEALKRAIGHGDNRVATRRQLAESLQAIGDLHGAQGWAKSCVSDEPSSAHWLLLGSLESALGRHELAATAYESAVTSDARSVAGWEGLGLSYERLGRTEVAVDAFQSAVALLPTVLSLDALTRLFASQGDWARTLESCTQLGHLRALTANEYRQKAVAHEKLGQFDDAAAAYEDAIEITPTDIQALMALGRLRLEGNRPEDAISALEKAHRLDPEISDVDELLANAYARSGRHEQAIVAARRQLARCKTEPMLRVVAQAHEALGQLADASAALAEITALSGESAESLLALGQAQVKSGETERAIATLLRAHELSGGKVTAIELRPLLLEAANLRIEHSLVEQALALIERGLAVSVDDPPAQFEFAKLLLRLKFADRALKVLNLAAPLLTRSPEPANTAAAVCEGMQQWREALAWYERANAIRVDDYPSLVGLGRCHLALGQYARASATLMAAIEQRPGDDEVVGLILQTLTRETEASEQRGCLESLVRLRPADQKVRVRLARLESAAQRHQRVTELLDGLDGNTAEDQVGLGLLAQSLHALGRELECQRVCQAMLRLRPDDALATRLLGVSMAQQGDVRAAIAALESSFTAQATPEVGRQLYELHRAEAARMEAASDLDGACSAYTRAIALVEKDIQARLSLARLHVRLERPAQAIDTLRAGLENSVEHLEGFVMLGQLYIESGRTDLGVESLRIARSLSPASNSIAAQLGIALSRQGKNDEALELLRPLVNDADVSARVREELATLERRRGDNAAAAQQLELLRQKQPLSLEQQRELALYFASSERHAEALSPLAQLFRADPSDFDVAFAYGQAANRANAPNEAMDALRAAMRLQPERADVAHALGELLLGQGNAREAQPVLERALSLGRTSPELHEMIAVAALQQGDRTRWLQALRERAQLQPRTAAVHADLAHAIETTGSFGEAREAYARALSLERNPAWFSGLARCCEALSDQAGRLEALNAVCEMQPGNAPALAEYGLARLAAGHEQAAFDALSRALQLDSTLEDAQRGYLRLARPLAQELLRKQETDKALALYRSMARFETPNVDFLLEYASCHSRLGQLDQAVALLNKALELAPGNESVSLLMASLLVRQGRGKDAIAIYERALRQNPNSVVVARALAMQYEETQEYELAARTLAQCFSPAAADLDYLLAYLSALTSAGRVGDAINVGRAGLERFGNSAELLHRVGGLYAGQGWHPQSVELLARAASIDPPQPSRYYLVVRELLEMGSVEDATQWLEAGLQRFPTDVSLGSLLAALATRADAAKDYRRSVALYQRALSIDSRNLEATIGLGNALVMLGQQAQAITVFEQAVAASPNDAQLRYSLGSLYAMQRRLADATRHWEALRTLNPELAVRLAQILGS